MDETQAQTILDAIPNDVYEGIAWFSMEKSYLMAHTQVMEEIRRWTERLAEWVNELPERSYLYFTETNDMYGAVISASPLTEEQVKAFFIIRPL